jgi:hypothetical protein
MYNPIRDLDGLRPRPSFQRCGHCRRLPGADRSGWRSCAHCGVLVCIKTPICAALLSRHEAECVFRPSRCSHCENHFPLNQLPEHEAWCRVHVARCQCCTVAHERRMLQSCSQCRGLHCSYCRPTHRCLAASVSPGREEAMVKG